ncbi:serine hydrolase [Asticcacaulis benevestitus]|uniref:Beta-lactamase-related domain-containing protein n=1 Tax=Asticcacaulis benevestitus DSM 16100 = ATCC BAA-896 TaxID=1121022 RepID=V4PEL1_9CAUL|nr:serine hydrolase [Asticcacaulis benevestitus]ESQ83775.1 hypothetical protein ABENE_20090 [Asticcacaulis benevestitus DSM 16100 = ATCC BAA-896]
MHIFKSLLLASALLSVAPTAFAADDTARMDQVVQSHVDAKEFMGTVLVARDGKVIFEKAYGYANLEWMVPETIDTKYRLGSVTKQFTAASILLLQERGKLKLSDPIKLYVPEAPAAWDKITIAHLLSHTSGVINFTGLPDYAATQRLPTTPAELIKRFRDQPLDFKPGEGWNYSNSGYVLLTAAIEKASGQTYTQFLTDNIFKPLGMDDTGYDNASTLLSHRASGYTPGAGMPRNADFIDMTVPQGAGGLYSTTHDLLKWEQGLFGGKVLKPESLALMTTPVKDGYAMGVGVADGANGKEVSHGGGIDGFNTHLSYYPADKTTIVVLSNMNGPVTDVIDSQLGDLAHGKKVELASERKSVEVAPAVLETYAGTYALAPTFKLVMTVENGQLMTQATGQGKFPLFAESETVFFLKVVDAKVEFFKGSDGKVAYLVLHQNGRDQKAMKE